jgi:hypothetical protein
MIFHCFSAAFTWRGAGLEVFKSSRLFPGPSGGVSSQITGFRSDGAIPHAAWFYALHAISFARRSLQTASRWKQGSSLAWHLWMLQGWSLAPNTTQSGDCAEPQARAKYNFLRRRRLLLRRRRFLLSRRRFLLSRQRFLLSRERIFSTSQSGLCPGGRFRRVRRCS